MWRVLRNFDSLINGKNPLNDYYEKLVDDHVDNDHGYRDRVNYCNHDKQEIPRPDWAVFIKLCKMWANKTSKSEEWCNEIHILTVDSKE